MNFLLLLALVIFFFINNQKFGMEWIILYQFPEAFKKMRASKWLNFLMFSYALSAQVGIFCMLFRELKKYKEILNN